MNALYNTIKLTCSNVLFNIDLDAARRGAAHEWFSINKKVSIFTTMKYFFTFQITCVTHTEKTISLKYLKNLFRHRFENNFVWTLKIIIYQLKLIVRMLKTFCNTIVNV